MRIISLLVVAGALALPGVAAAACGGTDTFGYECAPGVYDFQSLAVSGVDLGLIDESAATVTLPGWSFPYYGNSYTSFRVGDNGAILVGASTGHAGWQNDALPTATTDAPDIAPLWMDLDPGTSGKVYYRFDSSPQRLIVSWEGVGAWGGTGTPPIGQVQFQAHLYPSGRVDLHYAVTDFGDPTYNDGASAVVGMQDGPGDGTGGHDYYSIANYEAVVSAGTSYRLDLCGDHDGDGQDGELCGGLDCDDTNASVYSGAPELCDGFDNDCDGVGEADDDLDGSPACADCDDSDPSRYPGAVELCDGVDNDCSGAPLASELVDADGDGSSACADCDDSADTVFPGAPELCDGLDNDCNGRVGFGGEVTFEYQPGGTREVTAGTLLRGGRFLATQSTAITEIGFYTRLGLLGQVELFVYEATAEAGPYTLRDSGSVSALFADTPGWKSVAVDVEVTAGRYYVIGATWSSENSYYFLENAPVPVDAGWGTLQTGIAEPVGTLPASGSGFSTIPNTYPLRVVTEGESDEVDADGDGYYACEDCDDSNPLIVPGPEVCDGVDSNCDGVVGPEESDADSDGYMICEGDCDDAAAAVYPGAPEGCDLVDNDCDGSDNLVDADGDGSPSCLECDDADPATHPGAPEVCDGADNDCDGAAGAAPTTDDWSAWTDSVVGINSLRGAKFRADQDTRLQSFGLYLEMTSGTPLTWVVYESTTEEGTYDLVAQHSSVATSSAAGWHDSGSLGLQLLAGNYYVVGALWSGSASSYYRTGASLPVSWSFGELLGGVSGNGWTAPPASATLSTSSTAFPVRVSSGGMVEVDGDGDGYLSCAECDDTDASSVPGPELCNGIDDDCDAVVPSDERDLDGDGLAPCEGDCDDSDAGVNPSAAEICDGVDTDCDGATPAGEEDDDGDGSPVCAGDCDDGDAARSPDLLEQCDGVDNDCDGAVPADEADADGDGVRVCAGDCDDTSSSALPGGSERCDGRDNDCDGAANFGGAPELDFDSDGSWSCEDCADGDPNRAPQLPELCDGVDNDCSGSPDFDAAGEVDMDGDGSRSCEDCDDGDAARAPQLPELCDGGVDNDCDPTTVEGADADGDGVDNCSGDCDDNNADTFPGAPELCDGVDNDCDPSTPEDTDGDGDGYGRCSTDCDDTDAAVHPGVAELCDGVDNDCDPTTDEAADGDGDGASLCGGDCDDGDAAIHAAAEEVCDGVDNDCDADTDEQGDVDGDGQSLCDGDCDDADLDTFEGAEEQCDRLDNDCNGVLPAVEMDLDGDGQTECEGDCDESDPDIYSGAPEDCDGVDDDCDGTILDEGEDADGDGHTPCHGDCDDDNADTFPEAPEVCDGQDNDCDGDLPADELDADGDGFSECGGDCDDEDDALLPGNDEDTPASCDDDLDNDCDGDIDGRDADCDGVEAPPTGDDDDDRRGEGCSSSVAAAPATGGLALLALLPVLGRRRRR